MTSGQATLPRTVSAPVVAASPSRLSGKSFASALLILFTGLALTLAWRLSPAPGWWFPLLAGSALSAASIWRRQPWADGWSRYLGFGAIVLLACVVNRVLYLGDLFLSGDVYLDWPFYAPHPQASIIKAEMATMLGTLLTVFAWFAGGGARFSPGSVLQTSRTPLLRLLVVTYVCSLLTLLLSMVAPAALLMSGQFLPTMLVLGSTTAFFVPLLVTRTRLSRLGLVILMGAPFIYVALGTGMKETILLALMPTAYMSWNYSRRRGARLMLVLVALVVFAMVTSYIGFFRNEVWYTDRAVAQGQVFSDFVDSIDRRGMAATTSDGLAEFLARSDAAPYRGWAVAIADQEGYQPALVFNPLLYVFVPRMLWPDKPPVRQGWEYSGLVFGAQYAAGNDSSLSAGLYPALYLGQGWSAVLLGAAAVGFLVAWLTRLALRVGGPVLAGLFTLSLLPYALRLDEAWTVGAFSAPIINFVYIVVIFVAARVLAGVLPSSEPAHG